MKQLGSAIAILIITLAPSVRLIFPEANTLLLFGLLPVMMAYYIFKSRFRLGNQSLLYYTIMIAWMAVTTLTSVDMGNSIKEMQAVAGGLIGSIPIYYLCANGKRGVNWIMFGYILLLASTIYYLHREGLLLSLDIDTERLEDDMVNANDLAYFAFYTIAAWCIICYNLHLKWYLSIPFNLLILATVLILSVITASRQILIFVLPFFVYSLYFQYLQKSSWFAKISFLAIFVAVAYLATTIYTENFYEGSFLEKRMEIDIEDDTRSALLEDAFITGIKHPIFGVGPGNMILYSNDGHFSHNSFLELFATSGIFGTILFVMMIWSFLRTQIQRYRTTRNKMFQYLTITILFWAVYNNLYVFYSGIWLIAFFFLLCGYSDMLYRSEMKRLSVTNDYIE
jgi:O-antigen ligase